MFFLDPALVDLDFFYVFPAPVPLLKFGGLQRCGWRNDSIVCLLRLSEVGDSEVNERHGSERFILTECAFFFRICS